MFRSNTKQAAVYKRYRRQNKTSTAVAVHWADVWLSRLSHIAQFGLFLFTLGLSYFTVLPLYQKAVLEETIAKKEVELSVLSKSLDDSYIRLRAYAMKQFYIEAMPACGGLFIQRGLGSDGAQMKPRAEMMFTLDVQSCLIDLGGKVEALNDLKSKDRQTFMKALVQIGQEITVKRTQSLAEYETAAQRVTNADIAALPLDSFRVRAQAFIEKLRGGLPDMNARRKLAESISRENVGTQYERFIRERVTSLRSIQWGRD